MTNDEFRMKNAKRLLAFVGLSLLLCFSAFGESVNINAKTGVVSKTTGNMSPDFPEGTKVDGVPIGSGDGWTVLNGTTAPDNGLGQNGDFYIRTSPSYQIYGPKAGGVWGAGTSLVGTNGAAGADGTIWRDGTGAPSNSLGVNGDYYLQRDNGAVHKKASGNYSVIFNIKGTIWYFGPGAPSNGLGKDGDFYFRTDTSDVYQRTSSVYSIIGNIKGATGATGPTGPGYTASSTTSLAIATGSKTFTVAAGLAYSPGARARAASAADTSNFMEGLVTAYSGTSLTINVTVTGGSGTKTDWNINLSGQPGATGANGTNGTNGTNGPGYLASSVTSFSVGTGSKAFTVAAGLAYTTGARARASSAADTSNWMEGLVTSYSSTTLTINVTATSGSGTHTDWNINLAGQPGAGVATGGTTGQVMAKNSGTNFDTGWVDQSGGVAVVNSQTTETLTWSSSGDTNGAFYRIGTNFGAISWTNPHTAGRITVTESSAGPGSGALAAIVDRAPSDTFTDNISSSFFVFDLGPGRSLELTDWTYQSRDSQATQSTPTAMDLEGSNDGVTYTPIDSRTGINITVISTWLHFTATSPGYRYFKVIQPAANATATNYFTIGELELYGDLTYGAVFYDGSLAAFQDGSTIKPLGDDATTPADTGTVVGWVKISIGGVDAWIPYYQ